MLIIIVSDTRLELGVIDRFKYSFSVSTILKEVVKSRSSFKNNFLLKIESFTAESLQISHLCY